MEEVGCDPYLDHNDEVALDGSCTLKTYLIG